MVKIAALAVAAIESSRRIIAEGADFSEDRERYGMMQPEVEIYKPPAEVRAEDMYTLRPVKEKE